MQLCIIYIRILTTVLYFIEAQRHYSDDDSQRRRGSAKLGRQEDAIFWETDSCKSPTANLILKISMTQFDCWYCTALWNLFIQYICLHKETALQNAPRHNNALLSPAIFWIWGWKSPSCRCFFLRELSDKMTIFQQAWHVGEQLWGSSRPFMSPARTPLMPLRKLKE